MVDFNFDPDQQKSPTFSDNQKTRREYEESEQDRKRKIKFITKSKKKN